MASSPNPQAKRQRLQPPCREEQLELHPAQLGKFKTDLQSEPSPAAIGASRIAARVLGSECEAFFAHGTRLYRVALPLQAEERAEFGKEGVLIPDAAQAMETALAHEGRAELQSVALLPSQGAAGHDWLGSVDSYGRVHLHQLPTSTAQDSAGTEEGAGPTGTGASGRSFSSASHMVALAPPPRLGNPEAGWAGLSLAYPQGGSSGGLLAATALRLSKVAVAYRDGQLLRSFHTMGHPTAVAWVPSPGGGGGPLGRLLAVAEESRVTLWDVRQGEKGGLVQQLCPGPSGDSLYALAWASTPGDGLLACAGEERAVVLLEPRKWKMLHKWQAAVKYAIHYLQSSHVNPRYCYAAGLDYECICGRWDGNVTASAGNANSATGAGHGRAVGPAGMPGIGPVAAATATAGAGAAGVVVVGAAAGVAPPPSPVPEEGGVAPVVKVHPAAHKPGTLGMSFRSDSRWLGVACADGSRWLGKPCDIVATYSQSGHCYLLQSRGREPGLGEDL